MKTREKANVVPPVVGETWERTDAETRASGQRRFVEIVGLSGNSPNDLVRYQDTASKRHSTTNLQQMMQPCRFARCADAPPKDSAPTATAASTERASLEKTANERQYFRRPATVRMVIEIRDPADFVAAGLLIERLNVEFPPGVVLTDARVEAVEQ